MASKEVGFILALSSFFVLFVNFILIWYYAIMMALNRKPGVPFSEEGQSPWNIVFRPHQLTQAGLSARKKLISVVVVFVCTLLLACFGLPVLSLVVGQH
jgi:hypothetical protein